MKIQRIKSYAKINLALNIVGKKDNLHMIESIVAFINLYDQILIKEIKSKEHKVIFLGKFSKDIGKNNTISKLLKVLEKENLLKKKFKITVNKKIPTKAGLGGGSMNAADILKFFSKKKILDVSNKKLIKISKNIGSDVFLGLNRQNSILSSKNKIKSFKNCKKIHTLVVKPNFGCSTKEIYSRVKKFNKIELINPNKKMFDLNFLKKMSNSLESIIFSKHPKLKSIKMYLENLPETVFVRVTGSGSALVAYFNSKKRCDNAKKKFKKIYRNYWCMASKTI